MIIIYTFVCQLQTFSNIRIRLKKFNYYKVFLKMQKMNLQTKFGKKNEEK